MIAARATYSSEDMIMPRKTRSQRSSFDRIDTAGSNYAGTPQTLTVKLPATNAAAAIAVTLQHQIKTA
jgi:hypothetical protein